MNMRLHISSRRLSSAAGFLLVTGILGCREMTKMSPLFGGEGSGPVALNPVALFQPKPSGPTEEERNLPVDDAWAKLDREKQGSALGRMIRIGGVPADQYAIEAGKEQERKANQTLRDARTPQVAFEQMVTDVARYLSTELPAAPTIAKAKNKQVLVVDDVENRTGIRDSGLAGSLESLHIKLFQDPSIHANFVVLSKNVAKGQEALQKAGAGQPWEYEDTLTGAGGADAKIVKYHPDAIVKVSAKLFTDQELAKHRFYVRMPLEVWHPRSGQTLKAHDFISEYRFHPYRLEWISQAEDDALRRRPVASR